MRNGLRATSQPPSSASALSLLSALLGEFNDAPDDSTRTVLGREGSRILVLLQDRKKTILVGFSLILPEKTGRILAAEVIEHHVFTQ